MIYPINILENLLRAQFISLVHSTTLQLHVALLIITIVPLSAPLFLITNVLGVMNHTLVHSLKQVLIVIDVERTQFLKHTLTTNYQYKPAVNLTQQPTSSTHISPSTEPKFEINMYHPTTSPHLTSTLPKNHANAVTLYLLNENF